MTPGSRDSLARAKLARDGWTAVRARTHPTGVVHVVELDTAGRPVPYCHTGTSGWDPARMLPTLEAATCGTCHTRATAAEAASPHEGGYHQAPLWHEHGGDTTG